jgi:hypothetical protein
MLKDLHDRTLKWIFDARFFVSELFSVTLEDEFPSEERQLNRYAKDAAKIKYKEAA